MVVGPRGALGVALGSAGAGGGGFRILFTHCWASAHPSPAGGGAFDRRADLVDVLPAGARGADELLRQFPILDLDLVSDAQRHGRPLS